jgi:hypothetical protein
MQSYNIIVLYSLSNQTHTNFPEVNEFLFIHPNPNVCTLFIQKVQLFPLEILDFFNEFLKSGIIIARCTSRYETDLPVSTLSWFFPLKHHRKICGYYISSIFIRLSTPHTYSSYLFCLFHTLTYTLRLCHFSHCEL